MPSFGHVLYCACAVVDHCKMAGIGTSVDVPVSGPISPPGLVTGRRRESIVWDYFVFDASKGKSYCQVEVSGGSLAGGVKCNVGIAGKFPTNLKAHLKGSHPVAYEEMLKRETKRQKEKEAKKKLILPSHVAGDGQMTLACSLQKAKPYDKQSPMCRDIT